MHRVANAPPILGFSQHAQGGSYSPDPGILPACTAVAEPSLVVETQASCPRGSYAVVQSPSCVRLFATLWTAARQAPLSTISQGLLKFMSTESVMKTGMNSRSPTRVLSPNMVTISHISYFT